MFENAIEKQAECAAPRSSSGVVVSVLPFERAAQVTGSWAAPDESSVTVPEPDLRSPFQTVVDVLVTAVVDSLVPDMETSRVDADRHLADGSSSLLAAPDAGSARTGDSREAVRRWRRCGDG
jgi:hypothetical protein